MKVLCLIDSLGPGGAQRQLVGLSSLLKEMGYDVTIACYHEDFFYGDQLRLKGVPYVYLKIANNIFFRIWSIGHYIHKSAPHVVISYLETPSICACIAKLFYHKFKLIVSERNTTQHTGRNEIVRFNLFRFADYIVPNAFAQENYIKNVFPVLLKKVVTIPNYVDLNYFSPPNYRRRRDVPEVMVAASIFEPKNTLGFIEAVFALKNEGYRFHISWYGLNSSHIEYINNCKKKIEEYRLTDCLVLKEKTSAIRDCYQNADYFCLPSFFEGTPNVICEAMACGLPILCSDVCDNSRYVLEGKNGFLFDPKETCSIVASFTKMFSLDEDEYSRFCFNSRAIAEQRLSKETFIHAYLELIS